jgi:hypothetical protein
MNNAKFTKFTNDFVKIIKTKAPYRTGNLRHNAIRYNYIEGQKTSSRIYVDEDIAPYMKYTNQPWISKKWNGKQNPNEKWFNKAVEKAVYDLAAKYGGTVKKGDE